MKTRYIQATELRKISLVVLCFTLSLFCLLLVIISMRLAGSTSVTSTEVEVMQSDSGRSVCLSVILSVCVEDYCKLGVMIGPTNWKNLLTFGSDPVPDTDSGSLFHFPNHYRTGDFRRFISISHTVTGQFSRHLAK